MNTFVSNNVRFSFVVVLATFPSEYNKCRKNLIIGFSDEKRPFKAKCIKDTRVNIEPKTFGML